MNTILIVDDDPYLLDCLHQILTIFGYRVIAAQDAETALAVIHNDAKIELVITDYQMPKIDGLELTARLNRIVPAVPIIMCSAFANNELPQRAREAGVAAFVDKPFRLQQLEELIKDVLVRSRRNDNGHP